MSRGPFHYGRGNGWVTHSSGARLTKAQCVSAMARLAAQASDINTTESDRAKARHAHKQLSAAMAASFPDLQTETTK